MLTIRDEVELEERLSRPTPGAIETLRELPGDVVILGAGGKMGPSLARMVRRAADAAGSSRRVIAVSRFSAPEKEAALREQGVETIACDLTDHKAVQGLPAAPLVLYLAGQKFGTSEHPEATWVMNTLVPAWTAEQYAKSRIVAFSTGCVYPLTTATSGGSIESDRPDPPGEYAWACVARERLFEHFSRRQGTPVLLFRLNYAIDLRYGVLQDVARQVAARQPVDVTTGWVNVIWQGDANARAIQSLGLASSPATPLNVTGLETISVRELAERFAERFGCRATIVGEEAPTAWLSNAARSFEQFGEVAVTLDEMIDATADWVHRGGRTWNKPTHFGSRDGRF